MQKTFSYGREEKLKGRKLIEGLFSKGRSFAIFPLRAVYMQVDNVLDSPVKVGVGASSKNFKKAVERNKIKRLLREAYRTEKLPLHEYINQYKKQVAVFISYTDKTMPQLSIVKTKMALLIKRLIKELDEKNITNI